MDTITADILLSGLDFPEGPAFAPDGSLWFVEMKGGRLGRFKDGEHKRVDTGGAPNGITIDAQGRILFCDSKMNAIRRYDPVTETCDTLADTIDGKPLFMPNDLAFSPEGDVIFTCPGNSRQEPTGYVAAVNAAGDVRYVGREMFFPNGLAFTPDGTRLVAAETYKHRLWMGGWKNGVWRDAEPWVTVGGPIGPDGMAFDGEGNLYVAVFDQGVIKKVAPDGTIVEQIPVPGNRPTNCAFDPAGKLGLVVTEAEQGRLVSLPVTAAGAALLNGGAAWN